jgi:hypothetical protein
VALIAYLTDSRGAADVLVAVATAVPAVAVSFLRWRYLW